MNKHYVEEIQNGKKAYLISVGNITTWIYHSLAGNISAIQRQGKKRSRIGFCNYHVACRETLDRHANSQKGIIIYWIPTDNSWKGW